MAQQQDFVVEARGARISRWQTPFSFDVSFSANGRAWIYDTHLLPTWKRPGHWKQALVDRMNAVGTYSAMMLAMPHMLLAPAVAQDHRELIAPHARSIAAAFAPFSGAAALAN